MLMIMIMKVFLSFMMISRMMTLITTIRYEFASPEVLAGTTETLRKETLCMFTPDEVKLFN